MQTKVDFTKELLAKLYTDFENKGACDVVLKTYKAVNVNPNRLKQEVARMIVRLDFLVLINKLKLTTSNRELLNDLRKVAMPNLFNRPTN